MRIIKEKFSIKVFAAFTVFIFVISFSFTVFYIHREYNSLKEGMIKNGNLLAGILAHNSKLGVFSENEALLKDPAEGVYNQQGVQKVSIFNLEKKLLKSKEKPGIKNQKMLKQAPSDKIFEQLMETRQTVFTEKDRIIEFWSPVISGSGYTGESLFFKETPEQKKDRIIGFVNITINKEILKSRINNLLLKNTLIGAIFLLVGSGITFILAKRITKPLNRLIRGVETLGSGGIVKKMPVETRDEIGKLAQAFNNMSESLRKREKALRESEELYRSLVETSPDSIILFDLDGNIVMANNQAAVLHGYNSIDEMLLEKKRASDLYNDNGYDSIKKILKTSTKINFENNAIQKGGTVVPTEISASLLTDADGKPKAFIKISRDISERKLAEEQAKLHQEQLLRADKMVALGTLVSGVAHEINNPNNFIMLNTPMLEKIWKEVMPVLDAHFKKVGRFNIIGFSYPELRDKFIKTCSNILEGSWRIKRIVDDFTKFSQNNVYKIPEQVNVNSAVLSSIALVDNQIKKSTDRFSVTLDEKLPVIIGNLQHLEQVVINLVQNACQAIPSKDRGLFITTFHNRSELCVVVEVKDEGIGINADILKRIFDPFFTTKREMGGTGLGLSVSSRIVKDMDGKLEFSSTPDQGTTARVILPVGRNSRRT
ncbi:MAG: PAS domain S-box protein [Desulfobacterales bacterium]|nr:PAS domain S-box protein [Desulfobacterales bacterium]